MHLHFTTTLKCNPPCQLKKLLHFLTEFNAYFS